MKIDIRKTSKLMSLILRHQPGVIGAELDKNGWLDVDQLIKGINKKGIRLNFETLVEVVEKNNKKRFAFNENQTKIRANQGHSVKVDVELKEAIPPAKLYHGTVQKYVDSIMTEGIKTMTRLHVHLSGDLETAINVGSRRGKPVILEIDAKQMQDDGHTFYLSENGVWLTDACLPKYIQKMNR